MKLNFLRVLGLTSLLFALAIADASAQEGTPNNEIPDLVSHPELNLDEDKTLLFEPERNSSSEKGVQNKEQIVATPSKSAKVKSVDSAQKTNASKTPEEDALSFNFLYYFIQKFKISDIVEQ